MQRVVAACVFLAGIVVPMAVVRSAVDPLKGSSAHYVAAGTSTPTPLCPTPAPSSEGLATEKWYRYQGEPSVGSDLGILRNMYCGQACVAMAIQQVTGKVVPLSEIVACVGRGRLEYTTADDLMMALERWGVDYLPVGSMASLSEAVHTREHAVIAVVSMADFDPGTDRGGQDDEPTKRCHRYVDYTAGHWVTVHAISDGGDWVIVHDPFVFGGHPDARYWYADGEPKGMSRHYLYDEFKAAFSTAGDSGLEIMGPDWYRYQGEEETDPPGNQSIRSGQACVTMAFQYLTEQKIPISRILAQGADHPDEVLDVQSVRTALDRWGVDYERLSDMDALWSAVRDRRRVALAQIDPSRIRRGTDFNQAGSDPRRRRGRYAADLPDDGRHWVVVRGVTEDGGWVIVHDPFVLDRDQHWYAQDLPKGRNRYFRYEEFEASLAGGAALEVRGMVRDRLSVVVLEQPSKAVLRPEEEQEVRFTLQNVGWQVWQAGHYALVNVNGQPLGAPAQMGLDADVMPGQSVAWDVVITAPSDAGVHRGEWRFSHDGELTGPSMRASVLVIPGDADDVTALVRGLVEDARRRGEAWLERQWDTARRRLIEIAEAELERRSEELVRDLCGGPGATSALTLAAAWFAGRRKHGGRGERSS